MTEKPLTSPALPWKTKLLITAICAFTDAARRRNGTVNRRLLRFFDARDPANGKPVNGVKTADLTVDSSRDLWFRLFYPTNDDAGDGVPVIVFFHGGGFSFLSPDSKVYDAVCRRIARTVTAAVLSVNYRLAPENRCPAPYDDGLDVVRWLESRHPEFYEFAPNADVSRLFLMGDSAGGNIAHHVAQRISAAPPSEFRAVRLMGQVLIQPFFGGEERMPAEIRLKGAPLVTVDRTDWHWKAFLPEGSDRDHEVANVFGPKRTAEISERFPATLVFVGGFDPLQDWQRRYCEGLKQVGREVHLIEYESAIHAFYVFPELPLSKTLMTETRDFIHMQSEKASAREIQE